jgi:hypothetical protein
MSWNLLTPHCVQISLFSEGSHPGITAAPFASFFSFSDIGDLASLPNTAVIDAIVTSMTYVTLRHFKENGYPSYYHDI